MAQTKKGLDELFALAKDSHKFAKSEYELLSAVKITSPAREPRERFVSKKTLEERAIMMITQYGIVPQ